jgi:hypothetical protein
MKRKTRDYWANLLRQMVDEGKLVITNVRVSDGESISEYTALNECPPEHREGYRRALETRKDAFVGDVRYAPAFNLPERAKTIANLD